MADADPAARATQRGKVSGQGSLTQVAGNQYTYNFAPGSGPAPQALASLPAAPTVLVGRGEETGGLLGLLDPRQQEPEAAAVVVAAGHGAGAVGKDPLGWHL